MLDSQAQRSSERKREQKQGLLKCHETTIREQKQGIGAGLVLGMLVVLRELVVFVGGIFERV